MIFLFYFRSQLWGVCSTVFFPSYGQFVYASVIYILYCNQTCMMGNLILQQKNKFRFCLQPKIIALVLKANEVIGR